VKQLRIQLMQCFMSVAALTGLMPIAHAQAYPTKPIRLIVGFAPGGSADVIGRTVAHRLSQELGSRS
jgi:tripartite-type tricarboxylate transporter receptor subunit TctC